MKKLYYTIILFASASLHAMDNLRIVPFERETHYESVDTLLESSMGLSLANRAPEEINVLIRTYPATRSRRPDTILGVIAYKNMSPLTEIRLLAVAQAHRRKGYGSLLVNHAEEQITQSAPHTILFLTPSVDSEKFYESLGYKDIGDPFNEGNAIPYMYMGKSLIKE